MLVSRQTKWASERGNIHGRCIVSGEIENEDVTVLQHPAANHLPPESIVSVTEAEDTLAGSILMSFVQDPRGFKDPELLKIAEDAQAAAVLTSKSVYLRFLHLCSAGMVFDMVHITGTQK